METIPKEECLKIGYFKKPHGINGEVVLMFDPEFADSLEEEPVLFSEIDGLLVPWFMKPHGIRFRTDESALVRLEWIQNEQQAGKICGLPVYIKKENFIIDTDDDSLNSLVGYTLFDSNLGQVGAVEQIMDYGGNLLFQVNYNGREVLVPFNDDLVVRFDEKKKEIEMQCPQGIFNL